jgi:hypothetical protein
MYTNIVPTPSPTSYFAPETQKRVRSILDAGIANNTRWAYASDLRYF